MTLFHGGNLWQEQHADDETRGHDTRFLRVFPVIELQDNRLAAVSGSLAIEVRNVPAVRDWKDVTLAGYALSALLES